MTMQKCKICLVLFLAIIISGCSLFSRPPEPPDREEATIFSKKDIESLDISIRTSYGKMLDVLGEPDNMQVVHEDYIDADIFYCSYDGIGEIRLAPYRQDADSDGEKYIITNISITGTNRCSVRGIQIGDDVDLVVSKFYVDKSISDEIVDDDRYLYIVREREIYGKIHYDEKGRPESIGYFDTVYDADGAFTGEGYYLGFTISEGKVASYGISMRYEN